MSAGDEPVIRPRFLRGDLVRVKPGVRHYNYPDLPIGGWAGEIFKVDDVGEDDAACEYRVRWSVKTLENMHRVYIERCERDDLDEDVMWLTADELEADDLMPATIEMPQFPEWAQHAGDEQLAFIFGLGEDDSIPEIDQEWLAKYHEFLTAHLTLPFVATWDLEDDPDQCGMTVIELLPPTVDTGEADAGLSCLVDTEGDVAQAVPLADMLVPEDDPNFHLLADYRHWFEGGINGEDEWDDDEDDDEVDDDDEFDPNSPYARMFKATMAGLRSGRDILGDLPKNDDLERAQYLADELILSDLEPDPQDDPTTDFEEAPQPIRKSGPQVGRNDPCPCGSGKKYKKCCLKHRE